MGRLGGVERTIDKKGKREVVNETRGRKNATSVPNEKRRTGPGPGSTMVEVKFSLKVKISLPMPSSK